MNAMLAVVGQSSVEEGRRAVESFAAWLKNGWTGLAENAIAAAAMFILGWIAIKIIGFAVKNALLASKRKGLMANFIASVVTKSCWAVLAVAILGKLGVNVAPLVAGLGVTGFIVGFAFQESLGNLASGLMIAINEPFKKGDFIEAAGHAGSVVEVDMMATVLATPDNKKIVVPNKSVWGGPIVNYSAMATRRVDLQVGIAYGADVEKALDVIRETVVKVPGVLTVPAPAVAVAALSDSAVAINVRPWAANADYWKVYSATLKSVKEELGRAGIEIPFPQLTVHQA